MNPATMLSIITLADSLIELMTREAALANEKGEITAEQLADIKQRAGVADADWDQIVANLPK